MNTISIDDLKEKYNQTTIWRLSRERAGWRFHETLSPADELDYEDGECAIDDYERMEELAKPFLDEYCDAKFQTYVAASDASYKTLSSWQHASQYVRKKLPDNWVKVQGWLSLSGDVLEAQSAAQAIEEFASRDYTKSLIEARKIIEDNMLVFLPDEVTTPALFALGSKCYTLRDDHVLHGKPFDINEYTLTRVHFSDRRYFKSEKGGVDFFPIYREAGDYFNIAIKSSDDLVDEEIDYGVCNVRVFTSRTAAEAVVAKLVTELYQGLPRV
jgi:hypothetical protein